MHAPENSATLRIGGCSTGFSNEDRFAWLQESTITHFDEAESIAAAKDIVAFESKGYELGAEDQVVVSPTPRKGSKKQDAKKPLPPPPKKTSKSALKKDSEALLHSPVHDSQAMQQVPYCCCGWSSSSLQTVKCLIRKSKDDVGGRGEYRISTWVFVSEKFSFPDYAKTWHPWLVFSIGLVIYAISSWIGPVAYAICSQIKPVA